MEGIKIKNGEEQIKVGTTGTISSLMMKELDQNSAAPNQQIPSSLSKPQQLSTSVAAANPGKQLQPRKSLDEASSSGSSGISSKTRLNGRHNRHRIPMLNSDGFPAERTSIKHRNNKKRSNIVEVVDIKCGHPNKAWGNPISNSLKKLGFSKLSESIV